MADVGVANACPPMLSVDSSADDLMTSAFGFSLSGATMYVVLGPKVYSHDFCITLDSTLFNIIHNSLNS